MLMLALPVVAQPPGGGPGRGPNNGDGPRRGPRAKGELNRVWRDIAELEGTGLALSKAQAARVVALVLPVSKKSALSDAAAKTLADKINAVLTPAQRAAIAKDHPRGGRGDGPPGGPRPGDKDGGRRDGPPRDGDGRGPRPDGNGPRGDGPPRMNRDDFEKVRPFMDALNPFYAPTGYAGFKKLPADFAKDVAKRYGERRALLEKLSKRAKTK